MEKLLSAEQLANALGITRRTLDNELKSQNCAIPFNTIGKRKFFTLSEVLLATKCTPLDKEKVIDMLDEILWDDCKSGKIGKCFDQEIQDVIRFIKGEPK